MRGILSIGALVAAALGLLTSVSRAQQLFENIPYESPGSTRNVLDVILPDEGPDPARPTILYLHGGAWYAYSKNADRPVYYELARRGYSVVACNYELSTASTPSFPQAVRDVKNAIRWIKLHRSEYSFSPYIVVAGPSAGGHLSMMAAATSGDPFFETLSPPLDGYRPSGFINIAGFSDLEWHVVNHGQHWMFSQFLGAVYNPQQPELYQSASPIFFIDPCDPPGAMLHGDADEVSPFQHSVRMAAALEEAEIFSHLELVPGAGHSFDPFGGMTGIAGYIDQLSQLLEPHFFTIDLNGDGLLNIADFSTMLTMFALGDPRADVNQDGVLNIIDFSSFLQRFANGC